MLVSPCYSCHRRDGGSKRDLLSQLCTDKWRGNETTNYHLFSIKHELSTFRYFISFNFHHNLCNAILYHTIFSVNCCIPSPLKNADHLVELSKYWLLGSDQQIKYFTLLTFYSEIEYTYKNHIKHNCTTY